jgi:hypothetical protein
VPESNSTAIRPHALAIRTAILKEFGERLQDRRIEGTTAPPEYSDDSAQRV